MNTLCKKENNVSAILQENPITSRDLAFLQYISGSTGTTKGVMVTFGALNAADVSPSVELDCCARFCI